MGEANARKTGKVHDLLGFKNGMGAGQTFCGNSARKQKSGSAPQGFH
jgi:hypothetical protein